MLEFLFKDIYSSITTVLVISLMIYSLAALRWLKIRHWGRSIAFFILVGTLVSAMSALRDSYAGPQAVFGMNSIQSNLCSIAGFAIFLIGLIAIFNKSQKSRKTFFKLISYLFVFQVTVIESSRILIGMGG
ncbi:MAG: hypothetical protein WBL80_00470 [Erysipelotrichaceae bacterium]